MYFVYILKLSNGNFYKGLTDNIEKRISQHMAGKVDYTRRYLPFTLVHVEICESRTLARIAEKYFKSGIGREIIKELFN